MKEIVGKPSVWRPVKVRFLYRHRNGRYYVRTYANGKEKWTRLRTKSLSVAKNQMKERVEPHGGSARAETLRKRSAQPADDFTRRIPLRYGPE